MKIKRYDFIVDGECENADMIEHEFGEYVESKDLIPVYEELVKITRAIHGLNLEVPESLHEIREAIKKATE